MLVVADSTPLNILIRVGHVDVLPHLFHQVVMPTEVAKELSQPQTPLIVRQLIATTPIWLSIRDARKIIPIPTLDEGEQAAISLAVELQADLLPIDERAGRRAAAQRKIPLMGTIGILELAASKELIDLLSAFEKLPSDFRARLDPLLITRSLARDAARKKSS